jgi:hypothetical protein
LRITWASGGKGGMGRDMLRSCACAAHGLRRVHRQTALWVAKGFCEAEFCRVGRKKKWERGPGTPTGWGDKSPHARQASRRWHGAAAYRFGLSGIVWSYLQRRANRGEDAGETPCSAAF